VQNSIRPLGAADDPTRPKRRRPLHFLPLADRQTISRAQFGAPSYSSLRRTTATRADFSRGSKRQSSRRSDRRCHNATVSRQNAAVRPAVVRHAGAGESREPYAPLSATPFRTPSFSFRLGLRFGRAVERRTGVCALPFACVVPLSPYTAFHGSDAVRFVRGGQLRCRRMFIVASILHVLIPQLMQIVPIPASVLLPINAWLAGS
jgi:hypothetical protein